MKDFRAGKGPESELPAAGRPVFLTSADPGPLFITYFTVFSYLEVEFIEKIIYIYTYFKNQYNT